MTLIYGFISRVYLIGGGEYKLEVEVNYLAVLVAGIAAMIVGFVWYSKALFGKQWMQLKGYTDEGLKAAQKEMGKLYALSFVAALITAYVLTHIMALSENFYEMERLQTGLMSAFFVWLGFIMPVQLTEQIFGEKKWTLFAINTGNQLVSVIAMSVVIAVM